METVMDNVSMAWHCILLGIAGLCGAFGHFLMKDIIPKTNEELKADWKATSLSKLALLTVCFGIIAFKCLTDMTITLPEAMLGGYTAFSLGGSFKPKPPKI